MNARKARALRRIVNTVGTDKELVKQVNSLFFNSNHFKNSRVSVAQGQLALYKNLKGVYKELKSNKTVSGGMQTTLRNFADSGCTKNPEYTQTLTEQARTFVVMVGNYVTIKNYENRGN